MASNLCSGHLPVGLSLGRGSLLLVGPLFHFPQYHSGLVSSRNEHVCLCHSITRAGWLDWLVGLDLFNDDTCPSRHISRPTQVKVSQSCFNSLNILLKLNYIVQVWGLVEVNCVISDRRIPLLAGIPLCKSRELSKRGYSMSQLCSIHHDIPVTLHTPGAYGQWSVFDHNGDK